MAVVQGIREKVHLPIYDSIYVRPEKQLREVEPSSTLRFFVDVQRKTTLETNLQSASLLPHYNTFETRAMRVVISDLPPEFSTESTVTDTGYEVLGPNGFPLKVTIGGTPTPTVTNVEEEVGKTFGPSHIQADLDISLDLVVDLLRESFESEDGITTLPLNDPAVTSFYNVFGGPPPPELTSEVIKDRLLATCSVELSSDDLLALLDDFEDERPLDEQVFPNNGSGNIMSKVIYNSVTSLFVGEKMMIQMPTWFFPAGAGPSTESGNTTHGNPSPQDTFRFAEPIFIDKQQNFRVEIEIPDADELRELQRIYGPFWMWVVLDGYMTRGVQ